MAGTSAGAKKGWANRKTGGVGKSPSHGAGGYATRAPKAAKYFMINNASFYKAKDAGHIAFSKTDRRYMPTAKGMQVYKAHLASNKANRAKVRSGKK